MGERRFGRLVIVAELPRQRDRGGNLRRWVRVRCDCGNLKDSMLSNLTNGSTISCGCSRLIHGHSRRGQTTPEYSIWSAMIQRCSKNGHHNYAGRGINVCDRWLIFDNFIQDMGVRPDKTYTIERLDNQLGYDPLNCQWASRAQQARNKRTNRYIEHDGKRMTIADWADFLGVNRRTLHARIVDYGWPIDRALSEGVHRKCSD